MEWTLLIQDGIGEKLALAIQITSASVYGLIVAFYDAWQLALLLCGVVPAIVIILGSLVGLLTKSAPGPWRAPSRA
jgi:ATP-binding cassette subfamily B (MDR/TAP) protein 1